MKPHKSCTDECISSNASKLKLENINGWYRSSIRQGVISTSGHELPDFASWKLGCHGSVILRKEPHSSGDSKIPRWCVYFELEEDLVSYLLTFEEMPKWSEGEAAAFYAPYIPLTFSGVYAPNLAPAGSTFINTRYGTVAVFKDDVDPPP